MNSIERVMATISGQAKDRLPLSLTLSLYGSKLIDCPLSEYYTNPEKYVEGQIAVFNEIGPDVIFGPFSFPLFGKAFGSEIIIFDNQPPNLKKPFIKNIEDVHQLDFKKAFKSGEINYFLDAVSGLVKHLGDKVPIAPIVLGPVDLPIMLMGLENWLDLVLSDLVEAKKLIEKTGEFFLKLTTKLFELGATFIVIPAMFINPGIITLQIAKQFQDILKTIFSKVKGPLIIHEGGAKLVPFLEVFQNLPNVAGFLVNRDDSLTNARSGIKHNQILAGNIEGPELPTMSLSEIKAKIIEICTLCANDSHFILASSGADIPLNTPLENIKTIKKTLENYYEI